MKVTPSIEKEVLEVHSLWLHSYINGDVETYNSYFDDSFHFIGSTNNEEFLGRKEATDFFRVTADQLSGKTELRNETKIVESIGDLIFITHFFDAWFLNENEWNYYGRFRCSNALKETEEGWRFVYQHYSTPDAKTDEGETIGYDKINQENLELKEAVKRRTIELEEKNRALEIETSLEKVRSRTMAMQESKELLEVANVLLQQVTKLGGKIWGTGIGLCEDNSDTDKFLFANEKGILLPVEIPHTEDLVHKKNYKAWKNGTSSLIQSAGGKTLKKHYDYMLSLPETKPFFQTILDSGLQFPEWQQWNMARFSNGYLLIITLDPYNDIELLERFAKVFDQAYTRFLDLQKAEKQAREAQIEASLERVRAKSMAMHKTDELQDVVRTVAEELQRMGVVLDVGGAVICTYFENSKDVIHWTASDDPTHPSIPFFLPYFEDTLFEEAWESKLRGDTYFAKNFSFEVKNAWFRKAFEVSDYRQLPEDYKKLLLESESHAIAFAWAENSAIMIPNLEGKLPNEEEKDILIRFVRVFEQAYIRFLDLQKAEKQAKEAQIEAALERIRASAMAMHQTEELHQVLGVLFEQFDILGINPAWAHLTLVDLEKNSFTYRITGPQGKRHMAEQIVSLDARPEWQHAAEEFKSAKPNSVTDLHFPKSVLPQIWELFSETINSFPKGDGFNQDDFPNGLYSTQGYHKFGYIGFNHYRPATDEEKDIIARFAKEFGRLYQRYLDIKKAEAQAREAKIEASLERVRARAMAMHNTDELTDVLCVLFDQFDVLGINPILTHLTLMDEENETFSLRITTTAENRIVAEQKIDINAIDAWQNSFQNWKNSEPNAVDCIDYSPDQLPLLWELLREVMDALPEGHKIYPEDFPEGLYTTQGHFKFGYIGFNHVRRATDEEKSIIVRFAKEFGRTYQRFLELLKAEEQTREAQIEASLEKVRAKAMAMHSSADLSPAASVIFSELKRLGINTIRSGVGLLTRDSRKVALYSAAASEQGDNLPLVGWAMLENHRVLDEMYEKWLVNEDYFPILKGEDLKSYYKQIKSNFELPPEQEQDYEQYGYFICFTHGLFYGWSEQEFSDQEKNILKRFASVVDLTFKRFFDLQKAEEQARESQIQLSLERVRARSMAMQNSDELHDVLSLLFKQFDVLGIKPLNAFLSLFDIEQNTFTYRATGTSGSRMQTQQVVDMDSLDYWRELSKKWQNDKQDSIEVIFYQPEILEEVFELLDETFSAMPENERLTLADIPNGGYAVHGYCKFGYIGYNHLQPPTEEHKQILLKFANEFGQVYQRFLDIQKAEAQAREAQIEASLERVRSRSLAMHSTSEMQLVANEVLEQLLQLGLEIDGLAMSGVIANESDYDVWVGGSKTEKPLRISYNNKTKVQRDYNKIIKERPELFTNTYSGKSMKAYFKHLMANNEFNADLEEKMLNCSAFTTSLTFMKNSGMQIVRYTAEPFSDEYNTILKRFGKVFEQAYIRFLDLQKSEEQTREAQIEAALERVRSKAMAMHKSEELSDLSLELVNQVQKLGISSWFCAFNIYDDPIEGSLEWGSNGEGVFPRYRTPREGVFLKYFEAGKRGETLLINEIGEDKCPAHYEYLCSLPGVGDQLLEMKANGIPFPTSQIDHVAFFKYGYIIFITYDPVPESHDTFKRFAKVFEQSYTRFLDLQKSEEQAREADIQLGLERVRASSMAMQQSNDLESVASVLFKELDRLDQNINRCGIGIIDEESMTADVWSTMHTNNGLEVSISGKEPLNIHPLLEGAYKSWLNKEDFEFRLSAEEYSNYQKIVNAADFNLPKNKSSEKEQFYFATFFNSGGIYAFSDKSLPEETRQVIIRFNKAFGMSYQRFLDLQKSEKQAREARIDLAVERVRAKALAMNKSEEIMEVVAKLKDEVMGLEIPNVVAATIFLNEGKDKVRMWDLSTLEKDDNGYQIPFDISFKLKKKDPHLYVKRVWDNPKDYFIDKQDEKDFIRIVEWLKENNQDKIASEIEEYIENTQLKQLYHAVKRLNNGKLAIDLMDPPSDEMESILTKMGAAFDLAYKRFEDLDRAEKRAKEAQIEAALERVRARTMAMQHSEELAETAAVLFQQFKELGHRPERMNIGIIKESEDLIEFWSTEQGGKQIQKLFIASIHEPTTVNKVYKAWKNKEKTIEIDLTGKDLNKWLKYLTKDIGVPFSSESKPTRRIHSAAFFSEGLIIMSNPTEQDEESLKLLERFAAVFEQTYTRFLDLKRAEEQAREAQIEAALERVRAKTMAMHSSDGLLDVIQIIFEQLVHLNIPLNNVSFGTNIQDKELKFWIAAKGMPKPIFFEVPYINNPAPDRVREAQKKGLDFFADKLTPEENRIWLEHVFKHSDFQSVSKANKEYSLKSPGYARSTFILNSINLYVGNYYNQPYTNEENSIIRRFAKVFEQAYTRFIDLQKAEKQAKEAIKQAALDRIRGEIASMRTQKDLQQIIPIIWRELTTLGVPFFRCGVFIINGDNNEVEVYLSNPKGESLAAWTSKSEQIELFNEMVNSWRKNQIYKTEWTKNDFLNFTQTLMDQGLIEEPKKYMDKHEAPEHLALQLIPFKQGMLYIGSAEKVNDEQLALIEAIAHAFSIAYARYEDFIKLEDAKKKVDQTLDNLKAAQEQLIQSEKLASLGQLTAGIAHEIKNPLNFVNNFSEVSQELIDEVFEEIESLKDPEVKKDITEILKDVKDNLKKIHIHGTRADGIVKSMLQHSRSSEGKMEMHHFNNLVTEYVNLAYHGMRASKSPISVDIKLDLDDKVKELKVISEDLSRVIINVCNNGFDAMKEKLFLNSNSEFKPLLKIRTRDTQETVVLEIEDNGLGIPESIKDKILQPFFTTKKGTAGTGLGLSISHDIIKAHGGELRIDSETNKGTTFCILLPKKNSPTIGLKQ
ncbi:nuclear transport factor 2 family protein [Aegicerativicinus sediminis]|uniref:nuclear transport factor 2 family protein n=1 Tax=Aegicerativicinus sediminis TaxID=2893202 RepID=UPI001E3A09B1|nr:ATP-binding protein [Aegicerativicinus sediminis]